MNVAILTYDRFPNGNAGAVRQELLAKLLILQGYKTIVVGMGESTHYKSLYYDGVEYLSLRGNKRNMFSRIGNYFGYASRLRKWLTARERFDVMIVVDLPLNAMRYAEKYAKREQAILIHDSVEWYSAEEFKLHWIDPNYLLNHYKNSFFYQKPWKIIGISSYLERHFHRMGLDTIRIPAMMDTASIRPDKRCNPQKTVIIYAGSPGKKDCFSQIILAIGVLSEEERARLEFRVIGITQAQMHDEVELSNSNWEIVKNCVNCIGKVQRQEVLKNLEEADFTVLIRLSELRYAKAGFPTKVPESLATGTPVICNLSSDLGMYLKDGENAIILKSRDVNDVAIGLRRAIHLSEAEKRKMQIAARKTAERCFDYKLYAEELVGLIQAK